MPVDPAGYFKSRFDAVKNLFGESKHVIAFTGAGISTLSGIKDFRGKDGLYKELDADKIFDIEYFIKTPSLYYAGAKDFIYGLSGIKPNIVHETLSKLEVSGKIKAVITQNVDILHQKAGSLKVIELHGSPQPHYCMKCGAVYSFDTIVKRLKTVDVPYCSCGGLIKPDIVFFGEPLKDKALFDAHLEVGKADLMFVLGSSLTVWPAAGLVHEMAKSGKHIVVVNEQPTPVDNEAFACFDDLKIFFEAMAKSY